MPPRNVVPEADPAAAPAGVGRVHTPRDDPPRRAARHRCAVVRVLRSRGSQGLGRRLLHDARDRGRPDRRRREREPRVRHRVHVPPRSEGGGAARRRGFELPRLLARALLRVRAPRARATPTSGPTTSERRAERGLRPRGRRARGRERGPARRQGRRRPARAGCAARWVHPTRCATTSGATRTAASTC